MVAGGGAAQITHTMVEHIATGLKVEIPTILESFDYDITPSFTSTTVYGRMDPIFSYQNTRRSFTAVLKTPKAGQTFTRQQMTTLISGQQVSRLHFSPGPSSTKSSDDEFKISSKAVTPYLEALSDLFKMMYPLYAGDINANNGTGFMVAAPILRLKLNGITYTGTKAATSQKGVLFVPEQFKVSSISRASGVAIQVGSASDLRFAATAGGYTITLGGTILHEDNRVGWINEQGTIKFGQGSNFPYAVPSVGLSTQNVPAGGTTGGGPGGSSNPRSQSPAAATQASGLQTFITQGGGTPAGGAPAPSPAPSPSPSGGGTSGTP